MESCSALVVTYNNESTINDCLQSLQNQVDEIIVFDNSSRDSTTRIITDEFPKVTLINSNKNIGYGAAINKAAQSANSALLLIANSDVTFMPNSVANLRELMVEPSCGIVGPRIENTDGTRYPSPRMFPGFSDAIGHAFIGLFTANNRWSKRYLRNTEQLEGAHVVDWVSGSCMLVRRHAFDELGGFDEQFFMYMEDVDLCRRARELGWQVWFTSESHVVHVQGASTIKRPMRAVFAHHVSMIKYVNAATHGSARAFLPIVWLGIAARMLLMLGKTALNR
jgi:N-acetylglucosaminyl-diphospho-decaprenol L-rhamnosyltransferase